MRYLIEIEKFPNKDYTLHIYEGLNVFHPVFSIKTPKHWNKIIVALISFLVASKFINIFQGKSARQKFGVDDTL